MAVKQATREAMRTVQQRGSAWNVERAEASFCESTANDSAGVLVYNRKVLLDQWPNDLESHWVQRQWHTKAMGGEIARYLH